MTVSQDSPYWELYYQQEGRCKWCRETFSMAELTKDHFLPKRNGHPILVYQQGEVKKIANCVLACGRCNSFKGHSRLKEFEAKVRNKMTKKRLSESDWEYYQRILKSIEEARANNEATLHNKALQKAKTLDLRSSFLSDPDPGTRVCPQTSIWTAPRGAMEATGAFQVAFLLQIWRNIKNRLKS